MTTAQALRVLICSANEGLAQTMRTALRGTGVREIQFAATPRAIMESFRLMRPDVLLVDVEGPENDAGLAAIRFLRRWDKGPNRQIPIVATSHRRDLPTITAAINAGTHEYVVIPASGDMLLRKIQSAIQSDLPFVDHPVYVGPCRRRRKAESFLGPDRRISGFDPVEASAEQAEQ